MCWKKKGGGDEEQGRSCEVKQSDVVLKLVNFPGDAKEPEFQLAVGRFLRGEWS